VQAFVNTLMNLQVVVPGATELLMCVYLCMYFLFMYDF
jgi:hypothetical protein